jgi:hypothetical protein
MRSDGLLLIRSSRICPHPHEIFVLPGGTSVTAFRRSAASLLGMSGSPQDLGAIVQRLAALDALRADTTPARATTVFAMMTSPATWRQLTRDAGWTFDDGEAWLASSLTQLRLKSRPHNHVSGLTTSSERRITADPDPGGGLTPERDGRTTEHYDGVA